MKILLPSGWPRPKGYSNGIAVDAGRLVFLAGTLGWNEQEEFVHDDYVGQFRQALQNIVTILAVDGAKPEHIARMTWYVTDKQEYLSTLKDAGVIYREIMGQHYPAISCVEVSALMENKAKIEIETTAVIPINE